MGADVFDLAARVGTTGHVTGVDLSVSLIEEARRRAEGRKLPVAFEMGDSQALPFEDGAFDAVRTERMLMHVPDAGRAFAEMARILRPGKRMAVFDFDWETQFCDSPHQGVTRKIARSFCDEIRHGWIGRRLPRLFKQHQLVDISVIYHTVTAHFAFLQLLLGGTSRERSLRGPYRVARPTRGGPILGEQTVRGPSCTASPHLSSRARKCNGASPERSSVTTCNGSVCAHSAAQQRAEPDVQRGATLAVCAPVSAGVGCKKMTSILAEALGHSGLRPLPPAGDADVRRAGGE